MTISTQAIVTENQQVDNKTWLIALLVLSMAAAGVFASDLYLPSLPVMTEAFATSPTMIQLTITVYFVGFALLRLIFGPFSDSFGRRQIILIGFFISRINHWQNNKYIFGC